VVFGRRTGAAAAQDVRRNGSGGGFSPSAAALGERSIRRLLDKNDGERPHVLRQELADAMYDNAGIFRSAEGLEACKAKVEELRERYDRGVVVQDQGRDFNTDLIQAIELGSMLEMADCLVTGAIARTESRGGPRPLVYPAREQQVWLADTLE